MHTPFLISHHPPAQYDRCIRLGRWRVCARCLGLYPVLLGLLGGQIYFRAPLEFPGDSMVALLLPVPALVDWARGRFDPRTGRNALRFATGALLAVALARTIYLHLRAPFHHLIVGQLAAVILVVAATEIAARLHRAAAIDPANEPDVEPFDDGDSRA